MAFQKKINAGKHNFRRFFITALLLISGAAFLLRMGVALEFSAINGGNNNMLSPPTVSDLHTYIKLGKEIARGTFPQEFYYQPFYYAVFLPVIYLCSNFSIWAVVTIQSLLGGATAFLAGLTGRELFGKTAGLIAAAFTAISTPLLLYAPFHQNETLQCFNLTLLFFLLLKALRKQTFFLWASVGLMAGIATLTRGNILLFTPLLLLALWLSSHISVKKRAALTCLAAGMFLLVQLPFIIYNTRAKGTLTGPSTAANAVLALGNTPESPPGGRNAHLPAGPMEYPQSFHDFMAKAAKGISVPRQMVEWMCREPGAFFELQFRKLLLFWDGRELPNNVSLYGEGKYSLLLQGLLPGRSHFLLACALGGMFLFAGAFFRKHLKRRAYLYGFVLIYWGAIAVFYILSRFRAPILPLAAVFAGAFLSALFIRWKKWERQQKIMAVFCAAAGIFLTVGAYDYYADNFESVIMRLCRPRGTFVQNGVLDNGPFTCGAWTPAELKSGTKISKEFAVQKRSGKVKWQLFSPGGTLIFTVNGRETSRELPANRNAFVEFDAPEKFEIEIIAVPENTFAVYDLRRNYNRSSLDGETLPGEWVMRFSF